MGPGWVQVVRRRSKRGLRDSVGILSGVGVFGVGAEGPHTEAGPEGTARRGGYLSERRAPGGPKEVVPGTTNRRVNWPGPVPSRALCAREGVAE